MKRIKGLDSIRFVCACWVVMSHIPHPGIGETHSNHFVRLLNGLFEIAFNGPAAVIVFFVISGFCIHYPFRSAASISLGEFYARRYIRIIVPLVAAVVISVMARLQLSFLAGTVLWSLAAEIIYYSIYPLLFKISHVFGWKKLIVASFIVSYIVVLTNPMAKNYPSYGLQLNWLLGLPCWMLGCLLAEEVEHLVAPQSYAIWLWRAGIVVVSVICLCLRFFSPVGYPFTLNLFGVLIYFWLRQEVPFFQAHPPAEILEKAGQWSYSLYLTHMIVFGVVDRHPLPLTNGSLNLLILLSFILIFAYTFYLLVERPSHHLAKMFKKSSPRYSRSTV